MCRLVIVKDVTKILLSKNLKQQNSKIVLNQALLARSMLEPIKHIKRGIENKLQTAAANVTDWSMFQILMQQVSLLECQVIDLRNGHFNNLSNKVVKPQFQLDVTIGNFESAISQALYLIEPQAEEKNIQV